MGRSRRKSSISSSSRSRSRSKSRSRSRSRSHRPRSRSGDSRPHRKHNRSKSKKSGHQGRDRSSSNDERSRSRRWSPRKPPLTSSSSAAAAADAVAKANNGRPANGAADAKDRKHGEKTKSSSSDSSSSSNSDGSDEEEIVHFDWHAGQILNDRYTLQTFLGDGTFGRCVLAHDRQYNCPVALKIIRDVKRYAANAKIEADILKDIRRADPNGASGCSIMFDTFTHGPHFCLVFEPLGVSLYDFLKNNFFRGFWMQDLQSFAKQSMQALQFLHEGLRLAHTDLKPENILLQTQDPPVVANFPRFDEWRDRRIAGGTPWEVGPYVRPTSTRIKIIDFGNATYEDEHHSSLINTRQYRSPEVLLGVGWDERSDLWSIGCILMELYNGEQLFETHEELEHLALIERIIGELPQDMLARAPKEIQEKYLTRTSTGKYRIPWPERSSGPDSERHVYCQRPVMKQVQPHHAQFAEFITKILRLDPTTRLSAGKALKHPLFQCAFQD
mmetsp:Transcript_20798/g.44423  ORF Transcript_20798/g.44423 Transcript_20798/m.44423 type:complete len:500 (+) Transcript_20798:704-2203(+)